MNKPGYEHEPFPFRTLHEWYVHSSRDYAEPFSDVWVEATFTAPSGRVYTLPGFYDGEHTWRVRFSPGEVGRWRYAIASNPADPELAQAGEFEVTPAITRGFLRATPQHPFDFSYENGEAVFLMGDTTYNLFGAAHCGMDVAGFLRRRAEQGFNIFRARLPVSPYHPPEAYSEWQTCSTWPWGGSAQSPRFDRFNLDYFHTVDTVMQVAAELGVGFEMIMEAWGFEFPFNNRSVFLPEWEELWLRYLIARYDAYPSTYIWTLMNEYEHYPGRGCRESYVANRWALRTARWVRETAAHRHVIAVHNGPKETPFAQRFAKDPTAIDAIMFQDWGTTGPEDGWLAAGIEEKIAHAFQGWPGAAVFAEYGYERNPELPLTFPGFPNTGPEHNRRGAWRGAFCGMGVINGFENTWGPVMELEKDQEGVAYFQHLHHFFTEVVPFDHLHPAPKLLEIEACARGYEPLVLASKGPADGSPDLVAVYTPAGADFKLALPAHLDYDAQWYNPRTGELTTAQRATDDEQFAFTPPEADTEHPADWVLVMVCENL